MSGSFFGYTRPDRRLTLYPFFPVTILPVECNLTSSFEEEHAGVRYPASRAPIRGKSQSRFYPGEIPVVFGQESNGHADYLTGLHY